MTSSILSLSPYSYSNYVSSSSAGKLSVPVNPSAVIYAQFDYVSGVAASAGQSGVSVTKIQILNSLINNLTALRNESKDDVPMYTETGNENTDALIDKLHSELKKAMSKEPEATFMLSGAQPMNGDVLNLMV